MYPDMKNMKKDEMAAELEFHRQERLQRLARQMNLGVFDFLKTETGEDAKSELEIDGKSATLIVAFNETMHDDVNGNPIRVVHHYKISIEDYEPPFRVGPRPI